jgi:hypothetical protein
VLAGGKPVGHKRLLGPGGRPLVAPRKQAAVDHADNRRVVQGRGGMVRKADLGGACRDQRLHGIPLYDRARGYELLQDFDGRAGEGDEHLTLGHGRADRFDTDREYCRDLQKPTDVNRIVVADSLGGTVG